MATTSAKDTKTRQARKLEEADIAAFARLRILLDGFEAMAIYYFSEGSDSKEKKKRVKEIEKRVRAFQDSVKKTASLAGCPPGWCECDGTCVPPELCNIC
ncbi:MAG: hypothetical protein AB1631_26435 [Acidobacteriota bacterium]